MTFESWMVILLGVVLLGFIVHRFALVLREGELNAGVFFGNFQSIQRSQFPARFYFAVIFRVVIATLAILFALWILKTEVLF